MANNEYDGFDGYDEDDMAGGGEQLYVNEELSKINTALNGKASQESVDTLSGRVTNAETSISQNATEIALKATKTEVNALGQRVGDAETAITQNANEISLMATKTEVSSAIGSIIVGARNLALNTKRTITNSEYNIVNYAITEELVVGQEYTVSLKGALGAGKTTFGVWTDGGNRLGLYLNNLGNGIHSATFTVKAGDIPVTQPKTLNIFVVSADVVVASTIEWFKFEKGNKRTDYTPAPEEIEDRMTTAESSITQNANQIALKVDMTEVNTAVGAVKVGTRNIVTNGNFAKDFDGWNFWEYQANGSIALERDNPSYMVKDGTHTYYMRVTDNLNKAVGGVLNTVTPIKVRENKEYVLSYYLNIHRGVVGHDSYWVDANGDFLEVVQQIQTDVGATGGSPVFDSYENMDARYIFTVKSPVGATGLMIQITLHHSYNNAYVFFDGFQLEEGNKVSAFSPNPDDVYTRIVNAESSIVQNANQIALKVGMTEINNAVGGLRIGSRNLVRNGAFLSGLTGWTLAQNASGNIGVVEDDTTHGKVLKTSYNWNVGTVKTKGMIMKDEKVTISFYVKGNVAFTTNAAFLTDGSVTKPITSNHSINVTTEWQKIVFTEVAQFAGDDSQLLYFYGSDDNTKLLYLTKIQVEVGDKATDWKRSEEDIEARFTSAESSITQNANNIELKVSQTDYNGNTISSLINQDATTIKMKAAKIEFDGAVIGQTATFNGKVDTGDITIKRSGLIYDRAILNIQTPASKLWRVEGSSFAETLGIRYYDPSTNTNTEAMEIYKDKVYVRQPLYLDTIKTNTQGSSIKIPDGIDLIVPFTGFYTALMNGWQAYATGYKYPEYAMDVFGTVYLRGAIKLGTNNTIYTLPSNMRPSATIAFPVICGNGAQVGYCRIDTSGNIYVNVPANNWVTLDGILFSTKL